jgi:hypothetical protein
MVSQNESQTESPLPDKGLLLRRLVLKKVCYLSENNPGPIVFNLRDKYLLNFNSDRSNDAVRLHSANLGQNSFFK